MLTHEIETQTDFSDSIVPVDDSFNQSYLNITIATTSISTDALNLWNVSSNLSKAKQLKLIIDNLPIDLHTQHLIETITNVNNSDFSLIKLVKTYWSRDRTRFSKVIKVPGDIAHSILKAKVLFTVDNSYPVKRFIRVVML